MKIKYRLDVEDAAIFNRFVADEAGAWTPSITFIWVCFAAIIALAVVGTVVTKNRAVLVLGFIGAVVFFLSSKTSLELRLTRFDKVLREDSNKALFGPRALELGPKSLIAASAYGRSETLYEAIPRIVITEHHGFIFEGSHMAHVIPKAKILEGSFDDFMAEIKARTKAIP